MPRLVAQVFLLATLLLALAGLPAVADMVIKLKDGGEIRLPITAEDVQSVTFESADGAAAAPEPAAPEAQAQAAPQAAPAAQSAAAPGAFIVPTLPPATRSLDREPIRVGPNREYQVPSQAAKVAFDGSVIEIDAGTYSGDVAIWKQSNLIIRGVGGLAHIEAAGNSAGGKAIWVVAGDNITIENVELSGCQVPDLNGAGIRLEGANFTLRNSYIHDNQMGILGSTSPKSDVLIENSEFARNTVDYAATGSLGHNVYIGQVHSFTLRGSYVHLASIGHNVKTRAANNYIIGNRIMDEETGNGSYLVDLSDGGNAYVVGNVFHKAPGADNNAFVAYAAEGGKESTKAELFIVNNTAVSDLNSAVLLRNMGSTVGVLANNIFVGGQSLSEGPSRLANNLTGTEAGLVDRKGFDYHLAAGSPAIDAGDGSVAAKAGSVVPDVQYVHPLGLEPRPRNGAVDAGAYEAGK